MHAGLRDYYALTKPGIVRGNLLVAVAGFLLAAEGRIVWAGLASLIVGLSLVIASACACNNVIDRGLDRKMKRTAGRVLATGRLAVRPAVVFAAAAGLLGVIILALGTSWLAAILAVLAHAAYVLFYGYVKRRSIHGTLAGTVSGALPPVIGYVAVTGRPDAAAAVLFLIMVAWQMPHFYAIAIFRLRDYKSAGIPVLPAVKGLKATRLQIVLYTAAFVILAPLLTAVGRTGVTYSIAIIVLGMSWFWHALAGYAMPDEDRWARRMFLHSLVVLVGFSLLLALEPLLP
jgi:protoheme IX farnesyltransferase